MPETLLYSFLLPCLCRRSKIHFALHNAVVKIFLVLSSLFPPLLLCFLLQFSSLPFFCPLLLLFSVSLNLTLRKRATSPWILHVSKNSRTADLMQKSYNNYRRLLNYMILTKLYNSVSFHTQKVTALKVNINCQSFK